MPHDAIADAPRHVERANTGRTGKEKRAAASTSTSDDRTAGRRNNFSAADHLPTRLENLVWLWYVEHALVGLVWFLVATGSARLKGVALGGLGIAATYGIRRGLLTRSNLLRELLIGASILGMLAGVAAFLFELVELKRLPAAVVGGLSLGLLAYSIRTLSRQEIAAFCTQRPRVESWGEMLSNTYLTIDRRTLGLTRVCLGFYLLGDLFRRTHDWIHMFGNEGVLPQELILWMPQANNFSLLHGFGNNWELYALWCVIFVTYACVLVGFKTKVAQILSLVFVTSMNGRVLLIENGGHVVQNLLLLWTAFMPLGDRFSIDAFLASMKRTRETTAAELNDRRGLLEPFRVAAFRSLVPLVVLLQLSVLYYFNVVHKTGPAWHFGPDPWHRYPDMGPRAVHFVMYADRMVNPLPADLRTHVPFFVWEKMTQMVLATEAAIPFLLLTPFLKTWSRRLAVVGINFLHVGFGSTFTLGPFAWALCVFSTLLFQREDWDAVNRVIVRERRRRAVLFDPTSGAAMFLCRVLKRFDRYALLGFDALGEDDRVEAIVVEQTDGTRVTGRKAFAEIAAALPVGAFFAPLFSWSFGRRLALGTAFTALLAVGIALPHASVQNWGTPWRKVWPWQIETGIVVGLFVGLPIVFAGNIASWAMQRGRLSRFFGLRVDSRAGKPDSAASPVRTEVVWWRGFGRELMVAAMAIAAVNQALTELWTTKDPWSNAIAWVNKTNFAKDHFETPFTVQDKYMQVLAHELRFLQGWFMFSPNPVMDDGTIVVDAVTADGRHLDPFWGISPDFDLLHSHSYGYNQIWSDYFNRIHTNKNFWDAMVAYVRRLPERTGNPNDAIVSGEVYWTHCWNPKWGTTESYGFSRELMFTFGPDGGAKSAPPPSTPQPNGP